MISPGIDGYDVADVNLLRNVYAEVYLQLVLLTYTTLAYLIATPGEDIPFSCQKQRVLVSTFDLHRVYIHQIFYQDWRILVSAVAGDFSNT